MQYKVIVLDLDGTLTTSEKEITPQTKEGILAIQEQGCKVILASGRPTPGVQPLADELHLADYGSYILSYNGARIINCKTKEIIYNSLLPASVIPDLYETALQFGIQLSSYENDEIIFCAPGKNAYLEMEAGFCHMPLHPVPDFLEHIRPLRVNKCLLSGEPDELTKPERLLKEKYHNFVNIYRSEPFFLEILPQKVDKAHSLLKLLNSIGLTAEEMICCGDGFNDITMLETAGLGVAMENAQDLVKASADYITDTNDNDGVLKVIQKFML